MTTAPHGPAAKNTHSTACPAALNAKPTDTTARGEKRSRKRENTGTSVAVNNAVPIVINGSAVAGQAVRNVVSRKAFAATWCASISPAVIMAMRGSVRFNSEPRAWDVEALRTFHPY